MTTRDGDDRVAEAIEALAASNERIASAITAAAAEIVKWLKEIDKTLTEGEG